jgi:hypothetical protein
MSSFKDRSKGGSAQRAVRLNRDDGRFPSANWRASNGMLELASVQAQRDWRPQLPEDSAQLEAGFVTRVRALAGQI